MFKTFISTVRQDYEFSWVIESWNVSAPIWHEETQPFEFEIKREVKLAKLQHHTITQSLLILFKYIHTINFLKYNWMPSGHQVKDKIL
jgi:hypothetical protein